MHKGLITYPRPDGIRLSFAITMKDEELEAGAAILCDALRDMTAHDDVVGENFPW
jgi:hypothetical protein